MRHFLIARASLFSCALFFLSCSLLHAKCLSENLWVWPEDSLAANGRIVITGHRFDQERVADLTFRHPRLVSGDHNVPLLIEATNKSMNYITQIVLAPMEPLRPGLAYRLEADSGTFVEDILARSPGMFSWRATEAFDITPPKWLEEPTVKGARVRYFICGPTARLLFTCAVDDAQPFAVEVELTPIDGSGGVQKSIVRIREEMTITPDERESFGIDQATQTGELTVEEDVRYRARFTAIDASGNRREASTSCVLSFVYDPRSTDPPAFRKEGCMEAAVQEDEPAEIKVD